MKPRGKKSWKQWEINDTLLIGEKLFEWQLISHRKLWKPEGYGTTFSSAKRKLLSTQDSVSGKNILQEWRINKTFWNKGKLRECVTLRPTLKIKLKEVLKKDKRRNLGNSERKKNRMGIIKIWINTIDFLILSCLN